MHVYSVVCVCVLRDKGKQGEMESLGSCRTFNCTFYGVEVRTREISHNPLLLMGGAHVNLQGSRDKDDMMSVHRVQTSNINTLLTSVFMHVRHAR